MAPTLGARGLFVFFSALSEKSMVLGCVSECSLLLLLRRSLRNQNLARLEKLCAQNRLPEISALISQEARRYVGPEVACGYGGNG